MNKYDDAVRDYEKFVKDIKKARNQMDELDDLYILYKEINELKSNIEDYDAGFLVEGCRGLMQDDLHSKSVEYEMRSHPDIEIEWPVMGEAYYEYLDSIGIESPEINVFLILTEKHDLPNYPPA